MDKDIKKRLKQRMAIIKSIKETQNHDRETCTCEGCHNFALVGTIIQNGRLYSVVENWKDISPEEFLHSFQQILSYKEDKKISVELLIKKLEEKGLPKEQAKEFVEKMLAPIHIVFYKPPPMGILKEI